MSAEKKPTDSNQYSYFSHKSCEHFPCHSNADPDNFNCLFCYCPLYLLGDQCGGNFIYLENGWKDCSGCLIPHRKENYSYIVNKLISHNKANQHHNTEGTNNYNE